MRSLFRNVLFIKVKSYPVEITFGELAFARFLAPLEMTCHFFLKGGRSGDSVTPD